MNLCIDSPWLLHQELHSERKKQHSKKKMKEEYGSYQEGHEITKQLVTSYFREQIKPYRQCTKVLVTLVSHIKHIIKAKLLSVCMYTK